MNEELASRLLAAALALDQCFGDLDKVISAVPDEIERRALAKSFGDIVGAVNDAFIRPTVKRYPNLSPEG